MKSWYRFCKLSSNQYIGLSLKHSKLCILYSGKKKSMQEWDRKTEIQNEMRLSMSNNKLVDGKDNPETI